MCLTRDIQNQWQLRWHPTVYCGGMCKCYCSAQGTHAQVIIAIMDNWQSTGGVDEYVSWTGANLTHGDFYTNNQTQKWCALAPRSSAATGRCLMCLVYYQIGQCHVTVQDKLLPVPMYLSRS